MGKNTVEIILSARDQASEAVKKAFETVNDSHSKMSTMLKVGAGVAATALGALGGYIAKTGLDYNEMVENSTVAWTTLLHSQDKAKQMIQDISTFAKNTQFDTEGVNMMATYLNNAGFAGKNLFAELTRVADVSGAFNISADAAQELVRQMSQVSQAGVAYTADLNILQDRGVPIFQAIAKEVGKNVGAVRQMASQGKITAQVYNAAFNSIANTVKGSSAKQAATFTGMLSTLSDDLKIISGTLFQDAFGYMKKSLTNLMPILDKFASTLKDQGLKAAVGQIIGKDKVEMVTRLGNAIIKDGVKAFNMLKDAVKWAKANFDNLEITLATVVGTITAFKVISTVVKLYETWKSVTAGMTIAQWLFNAALDANPIGVLSLGIGALIGLGVLLYKNWDVVSAKMSSVWNTIKQDAAIVVNFLIGKINGLISIIDHIPGVSIPLIPKVSWGSNPPPASMLKGGSGNASASSGARATMAHYASGTSFHPGGLAMVGENGPEIVNLPRSASVTSASKTQELPDLIASAVGNAMLMALSQMKPSNGGNQPIVLNIDGRTFARLLKPHMDTENKRIGTQIRLQTI